MEYLRQHAQLIAQFIALIACCCNCISYTKRKKDALLRWQAAAVTCYALQYLLLDARAGLLNDIVSLFKLGVFHHNARRGRSNPRWTVWGFCILSLLLGLTVLDSWYAAAPIVVALIYTYATWQDDALRLRVGTAVCALIWIGYNFIVGAYVAAVYSVAEFVFSLVTLVHLRRRSTDEQQESAS